MRLLEKRHIKGLNGMDWNIILIFLVWLFGITLSLIFVVAEFLFYAKEITSARIV